MSLKGIVKDYVLPPAITQLLRPPRKYGPWGCYPTWEAAAGASSPYQTHFAPIEEQIRLTTRGEYEPPCFHGTHLAAIMSLSEPAKVLDFGGGVGLGYFRAMRTVPNRVKWWRVVDLPDVIEWAAKRAPIAGISYHLSIEDALNDEAPDMVTCSSVLQCMENSYDALINLFSLGAKCIVLDRIPIEDKERFAVFHTVSGDQIPWRILSSRKLADISLDYQLLFKQRLPRHPNQPDASDEFCLFYIQR